MNSILDKVSGILASSICYISLIYIVYILVKKLIPKSVVSSKGKAILITGCDSGFGHRLAQRLNQMGFKVYATVLSTGSPGAKELKTNVRYADKMIVLQMNVTNDTEVNEVYERVKQDLENSGHQLWSVVNNAGIASGGPLDWGSIDSYHRIFDVNVFGTVRVTRVFLPLIRASKGRIVNVASLSGRFSFQYVGIYSMTKHSLVSFSDTLRREQYKYGIKVTSIEPGAFKTPITTENNMSKVIDLNWSESSDEVKKFYGTPEHHKRNCMKILYSFPFLEDLDIVVDDMIDAINSGRPKPVYRPMSRFLKIQTFIVLYFPTVFTDSLFHLFERYL